MLYFSHEPITSELLAELRWRATFRLTEQPVEVTERVETARIAYLRNGLFRGQQHSRSYT